MKNALGGRGLLLSPAKALALLPAVRDWAVKVLRQWPRLVRFCFGLLLPLKTEKGRKRSCVCSICCDRRANSIRGLKRCPLRTAIGLKNAAGSKKAMAQFSLCRHTGRAIINQDIPPVLLPTVLFVWLKRR